MAHLFFKAAGFTSGRSLPQLSNVEPLIPNVENKAYGHWIFGVDESSLIDVVNGKILSLQSGATVNPSYSENGLTISTAYGNSLQTDLIDSPTQDFTFCAVVRCNVSALSILLGNLPPSNDGTTSGTGLFASGGKAYLTSKPTAAAAASSNGISSLAAPQNIVQTSNFFIAASIDKTMKKGIIYVQQADAESSNEATYNALAYEQPSKKIAIGNNAYTTAITAANTATFAETILFSKALTLAEIQAVALRSKSRLVNRNIVF